MIFGDVLFGDVLQARRLAAFCEVRRSKAREERVQGRAALEATKKKLKKLKGRMLKNKPRISDLKKKNSQAIVYPWDKYTILATQEDVSISDYNRMPICK